MPLQMNKNAENSLSGYYSKDQFQLSRSPYEKAKDYSLPSPSSQVVRRQCNIIQDCLLFPSAICNVPKLLPTAYIWERGGADGCVLRF